ncbi:ATP synthase E chain-domain-containing protein [Exophiala viscosa]|uniref:ATP synthase F(0) complex subunit e, mitochondrial n=1 Tax=Exophiala viscosa TaxID=2486360 RepID=A0AAN6IC96_9EURO|nr:ATP synthase E chain-domain-containing protein [Exophiala viscosa]KAI1622977.1 ATP synthase E chain-domain-containing protein [Exophiala viscosa]
MSTSQGVNVLRWSALAAGIFYGFTHQRTISSNTAAAHAHAEYQHKLDLIQKAKAEYAKKNLPPQSKTASGDIITDPNDKNFDLEAYLTKLSAES